MLTGETFSFDYVCLVKGCP